MAEQYPELWIIKPAERTNIDTNPSFELGATTGWVAVGASTSLTVVTTHQRRGVKAMAITPTNGAESGAYKAYSLTAGQLYTFSHDFEDVAGQTYTLKFADTGGSLVGAATTWTGTGHWVRRNVAYTAASTTTYRVYITRASVASTTPFYVDGVQLEAGALTTYIDGDMNGWNPLVKDYFWNGTPHASSSYRSPRTRSGGTLVRVRDYAKILGISGMGMLPVENYALPTGKAGSVYQSSRANDRELTVYLRFYGATTDAMRDNRHTIADAVKMDAVPNDEPVILRWRLDTAAGVPVSETLDIPCLYSGGLEDNTADPGSQIVSKAAVTFTAYNPFLELEGEAGASLGFSGTITQSQYAVYRSPSGAWQSLGSINGPVYSFARTPAGSVIAGGQYTVFGGAAATSIVSLSGTSSAQIATGLPGSVYAVGVTAAGSIYGGGVLTGADLQYSDGAAWLPCGKVVLAGGLQGTVKAIAPGADGNMYFGGRIGTLTGWGSWNVGYAVGTTVSAIGTGFGDGNTTVNSIAFLQDAIFAGYIHGDGTAGLKSCASGGTTWATQYQFTGASGNSVNLVRAAPSGVLYYGGKLNWWENLGGGTVAISNTSVGRYFQGSASPKLIGSINDPDSALRDLVFDGKRNPLFVGMFFKDFTGAAISDPSLAYGGGAWNQLDIDTGCGTAEAIITAIYTPIGELYLGGSWTSGTATTASVTTANSATARAYPRVVFLGPGKMVQLVNYTTARGIYFRGLTLQAGERASLDLRPGRLRFESNWRGNLMGYLAQGSDTDLFLQSGDNSVSAYMTGTDANSSILMAWLPIYWGVDGAMW